MTRTWPIWLVTVSVALLAAGDQPWKDKQISQWSEADARQVLTDSPWARSIIPQVKQTSQPSARRPRMGRRGGMGIPPQRPPTRRKSDTPPTLTLRWESAMPVQQALLKSHDDKAPSIDETHYAIAVFGVPGRFTGSKPKGELKLNGNKKIKASNIRVLSRKDTPVFVFLFPKSKEISLNDKQVEFAAHIGTLEFNETFQLIDMTYADKLEL